jgi:membrane-bound lytic murein transglycosylase A
MNSPSKNDIKDCFSSESLLSALDSAQQFKSFREQIEKSGLTAETMSWVKTNLRSEVCLSNDGLVTGYYLPRIQGSLSRSDKFSIAIYSAPLDSLAPGPGPTRKEIEDQNALGNKNLEVAWVKSKVDLFFVHIQGYGILELEDQTTVMLQKAGSNQLPYFAIGKALIEQGKVAKEQMSMQSIRQYFEQHPEEIDAILQLNSRYIYFNVQESGPIGSADSLLVPFRSVATDWNYYPPHSLLYIETSLPTFTEGKVFLEQQPTSFFALAHDSGSAIVGTGRIDFYCGEDALLAGHLNSKGKIYLLKLG